MMQFGCYSAELRDMESKRERVQVFPNERRRKCFYIIQIIIISFVSYLLLNPKAVLPRKTNEIVEDEPL